MYKKILITGLLAVSLTHQANAQSFFEACQKRFLDAMRCQNEACGPRDVLNLPPKNFCKPTPCKDLLEKDGAAATIAWDACMKDHKAAGGAFDTLGRPVPECTPNPDYPAANAAADRWISCEAKVRTTCDGDFIDTFLVDGGFDLSACQRAFKDGTLPARSN